jgi:hypothetical protein
VVVAKNTIGPGSALTRRSVLALAVGGAVATGCRPGATGARTGATTPGSSSEATTSRPSPKARQTPTRPPLELPRGGRVLFPRYRLAGWCGAPFAGTLGELGLGDLDDKATEMLTRIAAYADGRTVLPVMELIAVVVQGSPGRSGLWRYRQPDSVVDHWLQVARDHKALLLLNIQPGRAAFLDEVTAFSGYLREPDVGIALDPEWAMGPGQVPGHAYGHTDGRRIDDVASYLSSIVAANQLPEKVLVYHQVARSVVREPAAIGAHDGVQIIRSVDGIGSPSQKVSTWTWIGRQRNPAVRPGFKLFFGEDRRHSRLMTPAEVLALSPRPDYVMYE